MRFTVTWQQQAMDVLAELWLDSADADAVRQAVDWLDRELQENPHTKGFLLWEDYLLGQGPIVVAYSVSLDDRLVDVWDVWHP